MARDNSLRLLQMKVVRNTSPHGKPFHIYVWDFFFSNSRLYSDLELLTKFTTETNVKLLRELFETTESTIASMVIMKELYMLSMMNMLKELNTTPHI